MTVRMIMTVGPVEGQITNKSGETIRTTAIYSEDKTYRYRLTREVETGLFTTPKKKILWIMLNPSTATEAKDDPTIRKVQKFSRAWGYGFVMIGNAFAWRDTDPEEMKKALYPIGPDNDSHLLAMAKSADKIIVAWGKHGNHKGRAYELCCRLSKAGFDLFALGTNNDGSPCHPLYLKDSTQPEYYGPDRFLPVTVP